MEIQSDSRSTLSCREQRVLMQDLSLSLNFIVFDPRVRSGKDLFK